MGKQIIVRTILTAMLPIVFSRSAVGQTTDNAGAGASPAFGSIATPRPINPATDTTNPSARATQTLNPYLGSTPEGQALDGEIRISLEDAVDRGLRLNLGLIDRQLADASLRAEREHALSELLPQISARAQQSYEQLSFKALNIKLPARAGFQLPPTSGNFGYGEGDILAHSAVVNLQLWNRYKEQQALEAASALSAKDARDIVVYAVGTAYFQVLASEARLATAQAALATAQELNHQITDQFNSEVSPEIDTLRARVELRTAGQRVVDATNDLEKDKLTLDRITGIPLAQKWSPSREYGYTPLANQAGETQRLEEARADVASAKKEVSAGEFGVKAARDERLPEISFDGSYGAGGTNPANYNQVYSFQGTISVPLFTSGRIRSDKHAAEASLLERRAALRDIEGRADYDVRIARLDAQTSDSAVQVAAENRTLAEQALTQSKDRFSNGVTNYLEVLEAEEAAVAANENYIASLFSYNVAKVSLARTMGSAETRLPSFFGVQ
ncbi:MAG TPA: TolC family protein [Terracidiphilus sp.]|jgi:outer membrane protein TolC